MCYPGYGLNLSRIMETHFSHEVIHR
jgi:hypothetical protein